MILIHIQPEHEGCSLSKIGNTNRNPMVALFCFQLLFGERRERMESGEEVEGIKM